MVTLDQMAVGFEYSLVPVFTVGMTPVEHLTVWFLMELGLTSTTGMVTKQKLNLLTVGFTSFYLLGLS